jgi:hypothetical protein
MQINHRRKMSVKDCNVGKHKIEGCIKVEIWSLEEMGVHD